MNIFSKVKHILCIPDTDDEYPYIIRSRTMICPPAIAGALVIAMALSSSDRIYAGQAAAQDTPVAPEVAPGTRPASSSVGDDFSGLDVSPPEKTLAVAKRRQTQHGTFEVIEASETEEQIHFNGSPIGIKDRYLGLGPAFRLGESDLLLIQSSSGASSCPAMFLLLVSDDKGLHVSNPFGDCSDLIRVTPRRQTLIVRIGSKAYMAGTQGVSSIPISKAVDEELAAEIDHASGDNTSVLRPLLKPDQKVYRWCGILEQATPGTSDSLYKFAYIVAVGDYRYAATSSQDADDLGIGGPVCVTGRLRGECSLRDSYRSTTNNANARSAEGVREHVLVRVDWKHPLARRSENKARHARHVRSRARVRPFGRIETQDSVTDEVTRASAAIALMHYS
jgi:hypothetical protein